MKNAPVTTIILFILFALLAGTVFLQIFLSKRESKWFGLILPIITFIYSLLMIFNVAVMAGGEVFWAITAAFLFSNIPTLVLLAIYFGCREKKKKRSLLDKMNIQDL